MSRVNHTLTHHEVMVKQLTELNVINKYKGKRTTFTITRPRWTTIETISNTRLRELQAKGRDWCAEFLKDHNLINSTWIKRKNTKFIPHFTRVR